MLLPSLAFAAPAFELLPREAGHRTMSITVSTRGKIIPIEAFTAAIRDCAQYPLTATYMGVLALVECKALDRLADGSTVIYQRTGGNALVSGRHWVVQIRVREQTESRAKVTWDLVKHEVAGGRVSGGPFAAAPQAHPGAVWTPYNAGTWTLDNTAGTVTYQVSSDPGGALPGFMTTQGAVMAFPLELLKVRWGIAP
jgi:hypothetical protein